ncbi:peroxide stress protein YaaA [Glaciecola sp. MH2013]|uniref:peroxide stress protein YaaA n=1 Tax=Glaciecola sp. MH2013 TaxID=2785524 RepID=UPI00189F1057|nr:peroxide stress protein YaaA [Glaciecola sp. MH2013]MBF7071992.1 peroxide stress protein YaaA [Glaciecola sp. MH2013]
MLMVVSPAKNLDFESSVPVSDFTQPAMLNDAKELVETCKTLAPSDLASLMKISDKLSILNAERFSSFETPFTTKNARQALFAFNGDVYTGIDAQSLSEDDLAFAQKHLRILSGLYGLLRPLDLMQAYRLEMGTKLENTRGKSLYEFWGTSITDALNQSLDNEGSDKKVLVNLASNEYFSSVKKKNLNATIITPQFKDEKNGKYKIISFYAKKARGLMARYIIQNRISQVEDLKSFNLGAYEYCDAESTATDFVFKRAENA